MTDHYFLAFESIFSHPSYLSAPPSHRSVLFEICRHSRHFPEQFDDGGVVFTVEPGELMCTQKQLASWANTEIMCVKRALARFEEAGLISIEVPNKKSKISVRRLIEQRGPNQQQNQQQNQQPNQQFTREKQGLPNQHPNIPAYQDPLVRRTNGEPQTNNEITKDRKYRKETIVRHGGNVDNSQASSQHSPHAPLSSFKNSKEQHGGSSPSEDSVLSFNPDEIEKYLKIVGEFKYRSGSVEGMSIKQSDLDGWIRMLSPNGPEDFLKALAMYERQEKIAKKKGRPFTNPAGYLNRIVHQRLWEKEEKQKDAEDADKKLEQRLRANGAI